MSSSEACLAVEKVAGKRGVWRGVQRKRSAREDQSEKKREDGILGQ